MLRLLLSLLMELTFFIELALQDYFIQKQKIGYIFSFHSFFGDLIFILDMRVWMTYLFCIEKNNMNNVRCTTEGEKSNKCCGRNHIITICSFKRNGSRISRLQLSVSSFLEKIHKIFYQIINQSKFLFTTLTKLCCFKH